MNTNRAQRAAFAAALTFLTLFSALTAPAQTQSGLQSALDAAKSDYQAAQSTQEQLEDQADETQQQITALETDADALRTQLAGVVADLEQSQTALAQAQNDAAAAAQALADKQAEFDARYAACKQQITAMQLLNEGGGISLLSQAADLYELLTFWQVLNDLTARNMEVLDELEAQAAALTAQREEAEAAEAEAEQAQAALEAQQAALNEKQTQLQTALADANAALTEAQAAAEAQSAVTEEKRKAYEQATAELDAYMKAQSQKYSDPSLHCSLDFVCPLPSVSRISTYFGEADAIYGKPHTGVDFPAAAGTPVYAAADGVVSAASTRPSYGNCVQIDHGTADNGSTYATLYAHLQSYCVSAGQTVSRGQVIGYVGNTGDVAGANGGYHLHLELRINGTRTDPLSYIPH